MSNPIFVLDFEPKLLADFYGRGLAVRVQDLDAVESAADAVRSIDCCLHTIICRVPCTMAELSLPKELSTIPIALDVPGVGDFISFFHNLSQWRSLNLRVYLPIGTQENLTSLRVLSSLGIAVCAVIKECDFNWDMLNDLMTYSLLNRAVHAPIDPFQYLADNYIPNAAVDFRAVYFNQPGRYFHVDSTGRIALTTEDLSAGCFIADDIRHLDTISNIIIEDMVSDNMQKHFLLADECACCAGWRVCQGFLSDMGSNQSQCQAFCSEMMDTLDIHQQRNRKAQNLLWRPLSSR